MRGLQHRFGEAFAGQVGNESLVSKPRKTPLAIGSELQPLRGFGTTHDALKDLLARHHHANRARQFHRRDRRSDRFFAQPQLRAEPATHEAGDDPDLVFFHVQRIGQFGDVVIEHLERGMDGQLPSIPLRNGGMRFHRGRRVTLCRVGYVDRILGRRHCACEVSLANGFVFLLLGIDHLRVDRRIALVPIFDPQVLGRIARLLERLGHHQRDRLPPIAYRSR